ncbi:Fe-S oxidoreductase [Lachnospiraceae bacterium TWA4]|nr:Fe-S oxidoreductase [Lachnospiraceae bacterium TWA4]
MKTLLVALNSKYIHSNLAVYSLKAYAKAFRDEIEIAEYTINNYIEDILKDIYLRKPDFIGFSCYIWNVEMIHTLCIELAKVLPNTDIWLGGPEVSYESVTYLKTLPMIKGIMKGEGERTFVRLLEAYHTDKNLKNIPALVYRENEQIFEQPVEDFMNMDEIPFPYEDLSQWENKIIYYESSRGCPFRCSYCLSSVDKRLRFRSLDLVYRELEIFNQAKVAQVKFVDRTFNCRKSHALAIWKYIAAHDNGVTNFHFEISADLLDDECLEVFKTMRPGLIQLEIGVQSIQKETLKASGRKTNLEELAKKVSMIHEMRNIHQHLDLIAGLPYEDYEQFKQSFDWVYDKKPDQLQLGFLKLLKGTLMKEKSKEYGIVCQSIPPYEVLFTNWLSYDEVLRLKGVEEMTELYYNSNQYQWTLEHVMKKEKSAFKFFEDLSIYYKEVGYEEKGSSRLMKYELFYNFLTNSRKYDKTEVANLLTYDYCLREKIKKKPSFLPNDNLYRKEKSDFFAEQVKGLEDVSYRQLVNHSEAIVFEFDPVEFVTTGKKKNNY